MNDPIRAACRRDWMPASRSSGSRTLDQIWWVVLHDEEAPTAHSAAAWFHDKRLPVNGGPAGSAHLCVDDVTCYRCLANGEIPWAAASASQLEANLHGFHIEQAGYARWGSAVWRRKHLRTLQRSAYKTAIHLHEFKLPDQFVDAQGLIHKRKGVTTHAEITKASKILDPAHAWKYTHTDPGAGWPRWFFMQLVHGYYREGL